MRLFHLFVICLEEKLYFFFKNRLFFFLNGEYFPTEFYGSCFVYGVDDRICKIPENKKTTKELEDANM